MEGAKESKDTSIHIVNIKSLILVIYQRHFLGIFCQILGEPIQTALPILFQICSTRSLGPLTSWRPALRAGKIYLHTDVRMIIFRKSDLDTATDYTPGKGFELR